MKKQTKKIILGVLAGTLCISGFAGCSGSEKVDGTKTVATVNDEKIPMGVLSFMTRYQQAQTGAFYASFLGSQDGSFWDQIADEETGETYGEQTRQTTLEGLELMYLLRQKSGEYKVSVSEDEQKKIEEAAREFMDNNSQDTIETLGVTQDDIEEYLELATIQKHMYEPVTADADTEVSDDEAAQSSITYIKVSSDSQQSDTADDKDAQDGDIQTKEKAQKILDQVLASENADMDAIAKDVDENLSASTGSFNKNGEDANTSIPESVRDSVSNLKDGEVVSSLIEDSGSYYIVRLDKAFDEEATEYEKEQLVNEKLQAHYDEVTKKWMEEADITVDEKVLKTLEITAKENFTIKEQTTTPTPAEEESNTAQ